MATEDLINKIRNLGQKGPCDQGGVLGVISCKGTFPIPIKYDQDWDRLMEDTEIAFSKRGKFEKVPIKLHFWAYQKYTFSFVNQGKRPSKEVTYYPFVYLKRREKESEPADEPRQLWNERNSLKVSVKDLRNKMKAIPKTNGCEKQHLKDIFYGGVKLAVYCSDGREKITEAKIALTEYEPMFVTSIILNRRGLLCVIGRDGLTIYLERNGFVYLPKT